MPSRTAPTRFFTGAWRCEVPSTVVAREARYSTCSGRTLDGPEPNRPSLGNSSAGRVSGALSVTGFTFAGGRGQRGGRRSVDAVVGPQSGTPVRSVGREVHHADAHEQGTDQAGRLAEVRRSRP